MYCHERTSLKKDSGVVIVTLYNELLYVFSASVPEARIVLNFLMFSSKMILEEFVRRSLRASPLMKPLLTPGG